MKKLVNVTLLAVSALAVCQNVRAQSCVSLSNSHLRGAWSIIGSGWKDPSKLNPAFPAGYVPMSYVGVIRMDGEGSGGGSLNVNLGGVPVTLEFLTMTYRIKADCMLEVVYSFKLKELGVSVGPVTRVLVNMPSALGIEFQGAIAGAGPGSEVDTCTLKRVSMQ
jgi:hypothetical protein